MAFMPSPRTIRAAFLGAALAASPAAFADTQPAPATPVTTLSPGEQNGLGELNDLIAQEPDLATMSGAQAFSYIKAIGITSRRYKALAGRVVEGLEAVASDPALSSKTRASAVKEIGTSVPKESAAAPLAVTFLNKHLDDPDPAVASAAAQGLLAVAKSNHDFAGAAFDGLGRIAAEQGDVRAASQLMHFPIEFGPEYNGRIVSLFKSLAAQGNPVLSDIQVMYDVNTVCRRDAAFLPDAQEIFAASIEISEALGQHNTARLSAKALEAIEVAPDEYVRPSGPRP
jgi:hypothetical protein